MTAALPRVPEFMRLIARGLRTARRDIWEDAMPRSFNEIREAIGAYFPVIVNRTDGDAEILAAVQNGLDALGEGSLSWARLNQIMHLCSEAGMSEDFYRYYFLSVPQHHPYPVEKVFSDGDYEPPEGVEDIKSLKQLQWGLRRFMYDAMLYWGNIRQAYRDLRQKSGPEIERLFESKRINEARLVRRGKVVNPISIPRDHRYLISEMACKTYEKRDNLAECDHIKLALSAFRELRAQGMPVTPDTLRVKTETIAKAAGQLDLFNLMFEDSSSQLTTEEEVVALYSGQQEAFRSARGSALRNTRTYLSICNDLDVYVATSMRSRDDFREMAKACEAIFRSEQLKRYNVRYFDPTLSAANYHEDKGIIECLMVKTAKVLLYFAQHKESLGKVSEYAIAVSLGKPAIVLCPEDARGAEIFEFYRDKHPLLRLVEFETGIVNGAIITKRILDVPLLLERIFSNRMEYDLQMKSGTDAYYLLKERLTQSTVRVITDDKLLTETFWNNYHQIY